jgi:hypothetical protein
MVVKRVVDLLHKLQNDQVVSKYSIHCDRSLKSGYLSGKSRVEEGGLKGWDRYSGLLALLAGRAGTLPVLQIGGGLRMATLAMAAGASGSRVIMVEEREDSETGKAGILPGPEPENLTQGDSATVQGPEQESVLSLGQEGEIAGPDRECTFLTGNIEIRLVDNFESQGNTYFNRGSAGLILINANSCSHKLLYWFEMLTGMVSENTIVVVENIHFSPETERGWKELIGDRRVSVSIDLLRYGLLFFRKGISKQHFLIRY